VTYQIVKAGTLRGQFVDNGTLSNTVDNNFRAIDVSYPAYAFSVDLGQTSDTTSNPAVFAIGLAPDSDAGALQYVTPSRALEDRYLFFLSEMTVIDAVGVRLTLESVEDHISTIAAHFPRRLPQFEAACRCIRRSGVE
jgi:hypothetical protein